MVAMKEDLLRGFCNDVLLKEAKGMNALSRHFLIMILLISALLEGKAYAYIDPGTGSMLWQLLFAAGVGSLFYVRKAIDWVGRQRRRKKAASAHGSVDTSDKKAAESTPKQS
jgi:hypothetical protein